MNEKIKIVTLGETRYQLGKLSAEDGSFILMQALAAGLKTGMRGGDQNDANAGATNTIPPAEKPKAEDVARIVALRALAGFDYDMHRFVQRKCLAVCSRIETTDGNDLPMPISTDAGVVQAIRDDVSLVMRLELEVLTFNMTDFFANGGLNAMAGNQATQE
jgi:hypothetical protein